MLDESSAGRVAVGATAATASAEDEHVVRQLCWDESNAQSPTTTGRVVEDMLSFLDQHGDQPSQTPERQEPAEGQLIDFS